MNTLRFYFSSEDHRVLDDAVQSVIDLIRGKHLEILGPIPLPTNPVRFGDTTRKNVVYKRMMDVVDITPDVLEDIQQFQIPIGVDVTFKQVE